MSGGALQDGAGKVKRATKSEAASFIPPRGACST